MMFWMPSNIIWDIFNKIEAQNNRIEIFQYPIEKFNGRKRESIGFYPIIGLRLVKATNNKIAAKNRAIRAI